MNRDVNMDDTKPGRATRHLLCPRPYPALLSLVVPIYNEERVLPFLRSEIAGFQGDVKCLTEVVRVNDGSSDGTLDHLVEWASSDPTVKVLHLSRTFGHQIA